MILVSLLLSQQGFGAFVSMVVDVLKYVGLIKDGQAEYYTTGLNLAGLLGLFVVMAFFPGANIVLANSVLGKLAQIGVLVLGLVVELKTTSWVHAQLRGLPVLGYSYSLRSQRLAAQATQLKLPIPG